MVLPMPYSACLPYILTDGKEIVIKGSLPTHSTRFSINLCVESSTQSDTPLHFNPRLDERVVVRNHKQVGWGREERHQGVPFHQGQGYEVKITVRDQAYQIFVNNAHFCDFQHRLAKETVRYLLIEGDTQLHAVQFSDLNAPVFYTPVVPFTTPITGGGQPGRAIYIEGVPRPGASRFTVNLLCGQNPDHDDISLHCDVRFNYGNDNNVIVRNHRAGGGWGAEERHLSHFPFYQHTPFSAIILVEQHAVKVAVNGQHLFEFNHRIHPLHRMSFLNVQGDVNLTCVRLQ